MKNKTEHDTTNALLEKVKERKQRGNETEKKGGRRELRNT
jgi:hypothetical protein